MCHVVSVGVEPRPRPLDVKIDLTLVLESSDKDTPKDYIINNIFFLFEVKIRGVVTIWTM